MKNRAAMTTAKQNLAAIHNRGIVHMCNLATEEKGKDWPETIYGSVIFKNFLKSIKIHQLTDKLYDDLQTKYI